MSFCTQTRDTPYSRATSLLLRPSIVTAVITSRAIDMAHLRVNEGANYVPRQVLTMSCNQSPPGAPVFYLAGGRSCQAGVCAWVIGPWRWAGVEFVALPEGAGGAWRPTLTIFDLVIMIMGQLASFGLRWWRRAGRQARSGVTASCPP